MAKNPFPYYKTSPEIIQLGVMMYVKFPLSLRNIEDLLHERGIDIWHESVRLWVIGSAYTSLTRSGNGAPSRCEAGPQWQWHLNEVFVKIRGERHYLRRAGDHEGEVLEHYVTKKRDKPAALKFLKKATKRYGNPHVVVTDKCPSYRAVVKVIRNEKRQETGRHLNNRAENSHLPFRRQELAMSRFRRMRSLQKFVSIHSSVHNHFNFERHLNSRVRFKQKRDAALREWRDLLIA
jgi:putative transposase